MKVAVGSKNPVKVYAVKLAFETIWPEQTWEVEGVDVSSEVSNQPMSDTESITGARNRATKALKKLQADFGVGLEGGLHQIQDKWFDCGWIVILDKDRKEGIGSSVRIETPKKMLDLILQGKELGEVCDIVFEKKNSKQGEGHFGLMTKNAITRTEGYKDAVIMALSRFIHPHLFEE